MAPPRGSQGASLLAPPEALAQPRTPVGRRGATVPRTGRKHLASRLHSGAVAHRARFPTPTGCRTTTRSPDGLHSFQRQSRNLARVGCGALSPFQTPKSRVRCRWRQIPKTPDNRLDLSRCDTRTCAQNALGRLHRHENWGWGPAERQQPTGPPAGWDAISSGCLRTRVKVCRVAVAVCTSRLVPSAGTAEPAEPQAAPRSLETMMHETSGAPACP